MRAMALAIGIVWSIGALEARAADIACDASVVRDAWTLLAQGGYGWRSYELAAFIVEDGQGGHFLSFWPNRRQFLRATYEGPRPAGAVAVIHTHPNGLPLPSAHDHQVARSTGMPVYVVTRMMISRTNGSAAEQVWVGDWNPRLEVPAARSLCPPGVLLADATSR